MRSGYKRLGGYIHRCDEFNVGMQVEELLGISNQKYFQKAKTNTIGVNLSKYRIVRTGQFAFNRATTRNGDKISISLRQGADCIVSPSYRIFEVNDEDILNSEYLMMWFRRSEFDRYARFKSHGSAHEFFGWNEMCEVELPIPHIDQQRSIVKEYNTIVNRIKLNERLNQKLEETAQALYKHWFIDFEFPDENGKPYKSSGGEMQYNTEFDTEVPYGWKDIPLGNFTSKIGSGATPKGGKDSYKSFGVSLIRSLNVHDYTFLYRNLAFIDEDQASKLDNVEVLENDVLINITGVSVARCCKVPNSILPARVNQHVMIIRPENKLSISNYIMCLLCSSEYKSRLLGTSEGASTRQALTKTDIEEFKVLMPDETTRKLFDSKIDKLIQNKESNDQQNEALRGLKEILLSKMVKGVDEIQLKYAQK